MQRERAMQWGIAAVVCAALFLTHTTAPVQQFRAAVEPIIILPIVKQSSYVRSLFARPSLMIQSLWDQAGTIELLQQENAELRSKLAAVSQSCEDAIEQTKTWNQSKGLDARFRPTQLFLGDVAALPIGYQQDIYEGAVVVSHGVFVGVVSKSTPHFSVLSLPMNDAAFKLLVRIPDASSSGVLEYTKEGVVVEHLSQTLPIVEGQEIVTAGDQGGIIPNIPIGTIQSIQSAPSDPFISASVRLYVQVKHGLPVAVLQQHQNPVCIHEGENE
jgi:cell shape-determining protein MreC